MAHRDSKFINKPQWDYIHDPGFHIGWFDKEEDEAMIANTYYWTPAGTPFYSKSTCTTIIDIEKINSGEYLNGILYSWNENDVTYVANIDKEKGLFYGYIKKGTTEKYSDVTSLTKGKTIPVNSIMYVGNCTKEDVITQYTIAEALMGLHITPTENH